MVLNSNKDKWIHPEDMLINGKVTYQVKFVGVTEVSDSRGMDVVRDALQKLKFSRHIKRSEGAKPPKVELYINVDGMKICDLQTKAILYDIPLQRVSFCADDKQDKRLFSFIAKGDDGKHRCFGLDSLHQANCITLTIGQAFELAYDRFLKSDKATTSKQHCQTLKRCEESNPSIHHEANRGSSSPQVIEMSRRIEALEKENAALKKRLVQLESPQRGNTPDPQFLPTQSKSPPTPTKDVFDMQPFTPPPLVKLPSPNEVHPPRIPARNQTSSTRSDEFNRQLFEAATSQNSRSLQEGFSRGLAIKEAEMSLDAFDPLKSGK